MGLWSRRIVLNDPTEFLKENGMWKLFLLVALVGVSSATFTTGDAFEVNQASGTTVSWTKPQSQGGWNPVGTPRSLQGSASLNVIANTTYPSDWSVVVSGGQQAILTYSGYMDLSKAINFALYFWLDSTPNQSSLIKMRIHDASNNSREITASLNGKPTGSLQWVLFFKGHFEPYVNLQAVIEVRFTIVSQTNLNIRCGMLTSA